MALATNDTKDGINWTGATGSTIGPFQLVGGQYLMGTEAAGTSVQLNVIDPAGNPIPVTGGGFTTTAGTAYLNLCPGQYNVVTVSASAIAGFLQRVPHVPA
jgi:hypothetical protein